MKWLGNRRSRLFRGQKGFSPLELTPAAAFNCLFRTGVITAIGATAGATSVFDEQVGAMNLESTWADSADLVFNANLALSVGGLSVTSDQVR